MAGRYEVDMVNGSLMKKIILFSIPVILSSVLQFLFNAADTVVIGRFAGSQSLAAVGSTSSMIAMFIHLFIGLSVGVNAVTAKLIGMGDEDGLKDAIHTAMATAILSGIILVFMGMFLTRPMLVLMGSPEDVIDKSALYLKIYFAGMPAMMIYNFGSSVLRAFGDTKRPLRFLIFAGILNVSLNLVFVIVFKMDVAGVGLATTLSQYLSAALVFRCLCEKNERYTVELNKIKVHFRWFKNIVIIGIPSGLSNLLFSISNIVVQSTVNSFGSVVMAGSAAASSIENIPYMAMNGVQQAALTFASQNYGAGKYERIKKVSVCCIIIVTIVGLVLGNTVAYFREDLAGIYSTDAEIIKYAALRMMIVCPVYFLMGNVDTLSGLLRAIGYSMHAMIISTIFVCGTRLVYIYTIFKMFNTYEMIYIIYPISWIFSIICQGAVLIYGYKKLIKERVTY